MRELRSILLALFEGKKLAQGSSVNRFGELASMRYLEA